MTTRTKEQYEDMVKSLKSQIDIDINDVYCIMMQFNIDMAECFVNESFNRNMNIKAFNAGFSKPNSTTNLLEKLGSVIEVQTKQLNIINSIIADM